MNKNIIYEKFFDLLSDSMEWACDYKEYFKYVDGVIDMANTILDEFDQKGEKV